MDTTTLRPLSITLPADLRLGKRTVPAGAVIRYAEVAPGTVGIRLQSGEGIKVYVDEFRAALSKCGEPISHERGGEILGCPAKAFAARALHLGYKVTCSRCGGDGNYSYCQTYGTRCFQCAGRRESLARITEAVALDCKARADAGELDQYLADVAAKLAAKRAIGPLWRAIGARPSPIGADYETAYAATRKVGGGLCEWSETARRIVGNAPVMRAQTLRNAIHHVAHRAWMDFSITGSRDFAGMEATLRACTAAFDALDAAWADFKAGDGDPFTVTPEAP